MNLIWLFLAHYSLRKVALLSNVITTGGHLDTTYLHPSLLLSVPTAIKLYVRSHGTLQTLYQNRDHLHWDAPTLHLLLFILERDTPVLPELFKSKYCRSLDSVNGLLCKSSMQSTFSLLYHSFNFCFFNKHCNRSTCFAKYVQWWYHFFNDWSMVIQVFGSFWP